MLNDIQYGNQWDLMPLKAYLSLIKKKKKKKKKKTLGKKNVVKYNYIEITLHTAVPW